MGVSGDIPGCMRVKAALSVAFIATLAFPTSCSSEPVDEQPALKSQVQAMSDRFLELWNEGDADGLSKLFAEDGVRVISGDQLPSAGHDAIKDSFVRGMEKHRSSSETKLVSEIANAVDLGGDIVLAEGSFTLNDKEDAKLLGGKWGCVYRKTKGGLQILMESAHVAEDTLSEPIDYSKIKREKPSGEVDNGNAAEYLGAMNQIIETYGDGIKAGDAAMIASTFTEDGVQLVGSSAKAHRGRKEIAAAQEAVLPASGHSGMALTGQVLRQRKISDSLVVANGLWQIAGEDGVLVDFGQWGNLMQIQPDGSLKMLMESAGGYHVPQ
jgi:uncharacterized protein (TIGR02246 family)